jgi:hypothetical protein
MTGPNVRNRRKQSGWKGFIVFYQSITMSTKTKTKKPVLPIPAVFQAMMTQKGVCWLDADQLGSKKDFTLRATKFSFDDENGMVILLKLEWRQCMTTGAIMEFGSTAKEDTWKTWGFNSIVAKFHMSCSEWDEDTIKKLKQIELNWEVSKADNEGKLDPSRECPWLVSQGDKPFTFELQDRRMVDVEFGDFTVFQGPVFGSGEALSVETRARKWKDAVLPKFDMASYKAVSVPATPPTGVTAGSIAFPATPPTGVTAGSIAFPARQPAQ